MIGAGAMGAVARRRRWRAGCPAPRSSRSYDADPARAKEVADGASAPTPPTSASALIEGDDVDAVLIAAPDPLHEELALACLAAGKPTLCEKPLATSVEGSRRVVEAEVARGPPAAPGGLHAPLRPGVRRAARGRRTTGAIGDVRAVHCVHRNAAGPPDRDVGGRARELDDPRVRLRAVAARRPAGRGHGLRADACPTGALQDVAGRGARDGGRRGRHRRGVRQRAATATTSTPRSPATAGTVSLTPPYGSRCAADGSRRPGGEVGLRGALRRRLPDRAAVVGRRRRAPVTPTGASAWDGHLANLAADGRASISAQRHPRDSPPPTRPTSTALTTAPLGVCLVNHPGAWSTRQTSWRSVFAW